LLAAAMVTVVLGLVGLVGAGGALAAEADRAGVRAIAVSDDRLVPASGRLAGSTGGQLLGEEVRLLLELPRSANPLAGAGESCFPTADGKVLIVWTRPTPPTCTVKPGTAIFLFSVFAECSDVEPAPFFGATAAEQRACALENLRGFPVDASRVSIDGGTPVDIRSNRYLAVSPQMTADLPTDDILGVDAEAATFVAAAWVAMIRPLPPGTHTIAVDVDSTDPAFDVATSAIVEVVPGQRRP
jgi:hypothetical protein